MKKNVYYIISLCIALALTFFIIFTAGQLPSWVTISVSVLAAIAMIVIALLGRNKKSK